jgi:hypothetical protein
MTDEVDEMSAASRGSIAYRETVEDVRFKESGAPGELRVSEAGTHDDDDNWECVDLDFLWINACCDPKKHAGDEVMLSREQVAKLAATLTRWVEAGILSDASGDAE